MTKDELNNIYFEWMCRFVCGGQSFKKRSYRKLLCYLHGTDFSYILPMDGNRAEDGIELRYRFGRECSYDEYIVSAYLDSRPCSILEMMIALAIRCEEHIMDDPDMGDRTGQWFWNMINNLHLFSMDDSKFDKKFVNDSISKFLNRKYDKNGDGGLFTVENGKRDLRSVEIWYQMCWYLDSIA